MRRVARARQGMRAEEATVMGDAVWPSVVGRAPEPGARALCGTEPATVEAVPGWLEFAAPEWAGVRPTGRETTQPSRDALASWARRWERRTSGAPSPRPPSGGVAARLLGPSGPDGRASGYPAATPAVLFRAAPRRRPIQREAYPSEIALSTAEEETCRG